MLRYLGSIVVGAAASKNNTNAATPFDVPRGTVTLLLYTTAADVSVEVTPDDTTPSTFATDATKGLPLAANTVTRVATRSSGQRPVVACFSVAGATVRVWAAL